MTLRHYAFSRQHRTQFSEEVYAFVLWRYVAVQNWRVKELFVPGIVASTIKMIKSVFATDLMADRSPPIYDKIW